MNLKELTEFLIQSIVKDVNQVSVSEVVKDDKTTLLVKVSDADMGRVIGKSGKVINAIRTLIQEACSLRCDSYVSIEVEKWNETEK